MKEHGPEAGDVILLYDELMMMTTLFMIIDPFNI